MIIQVVQFIITVIAILSSLLWLSNFVADIVNPQVDVMNGDIIPKPRNSRFWAALIAAVLWAVLFAFF